MIVGRSRFWICATLVAVVGLAVVGSANAALFGLWKSSKKKAVEPKQYVVVFPFDQRDVTNVPVDFGSYVASDLRGMLSGSDKYNVLVYRSRLSPIERAKNDGEVIEEDITAPFSSEDRAKTFRLAKLLASDYYVIGSIDDCQIDTSKKAALVTISAELIDSKTGKLLKMLIVTGRAPDNVKSAEKEELRDLAKGDAITKLSAEILAPKKTSEPESEQPAASEPAKPEAEPEVVQKAPPTNTPAKGGK